MNRKIIVRLISLIFVLLIWEYYGRRVNPILFTYPSAIARAFVAGPDVLFADEPTGNLDAGTGGRIMDLLFGLNAGAGTTLILVTHDQSIAARCGRLVRLDAGRMIDGAA